MNFGLAAWPKKNLGSRKKPERWVRHKRENPKIHMNSPWSLYTQLFFNEFAAEFPESWRPNGSLSLRVWTFPIPMRVFFFFFGGVGGQTIVRNQHPKPTFRSAKCFRSVNGVDLRDIDLKSTNWTFIKDEITKDGLKKIDKVENLSMALRVVTSEICHMSIGCPLVWKKIKDLD